MNSSTPLPNAQGVDVLADADRENESPRKKSAMKSTIDYAKYISFGLGLESIANITRDGRISLDFDFKKRAPTLSTLSEFLSRTVEEVGVDKDNWNDCPSLNIVIMIVGSRGDVQPYVALGQQFSKEGHRVRIATHETFRSFVTQAGLEFFNIGGNPQDLMSYMVKNPGLIPGFESLINGDISKKRKMLSEMINGCWDACHSPDPITGRAFAADAIISNPPAFAHVHCAEALGIPLLLSFTMPWSPTISFAHPLVNITASNGAYSVNNYLSYAAVELLTWQGIGDIINKFRIKIGLPSLSIRTGPGYADRLDIPWTYCISPALVPKPSDWKDHIDVTGFYFLDLASTYEPSPELAAFLSAGDPPVYIGFGSVVIEDPAALSETIFQATKQAGVRAVVSSGWGGLGSSSAPPNVFIIGNVPHDWLFAEGRVSAVVHHGGAGTTAVGLAKGRPTVVVPFFGDQGFWGNMIYKAGAGPKPIPPKELNVDRLCDAIKFAISPAAKEAARSLAQKIHDEDGVRRGVDSFYKHLPLMRMRCDLDPSRVAVWWLKEQCLRLSAFAAQTLADAGLISMQDLVLHRPKEYFQRTTSEQSKEGGANAYFLSLTEQNKQGRKRSGLPVASHGVFDAIASMHEGLRYSHHPENSKESSSTRSAHSRDSSISSVSSVSSEVPLLSHPRPTVDANPPKASLVQGPWKLYETPSGKAVYTRERLTRIAEGRKAVKFSTEDERAAIIKKLNREICETPTRQTLLRQAESDERVQNTDPLKLKAEHDETARTTASISAVSAPSSQMAPETLSPRRSGDMISGQARQTSPQSTLNDDDEIFRQDLELALKISLENAVNRSN